MRGARVGCWEEWGLSLVPQLPAIAIRGARGRAGVGVCVGVGDGAVADSTSLSDT